MAATDVLLLRRFSSDPPALQTRLDTNPTLLVSWFCTIFSLVVICVRLLGRWVRTEKLFREDKVMFWSIIPLLGRMGCVHVVLIWGTNQTVTAGLTIEAIRHREIGSRLVLVSRILYAAYIWIAKITMVEFLQRLIGASWSKSYEIGLRIIYALLGLTFVAVVISTLAECQPFTHYWQVVPDPGPACRAGVRQLLTMGICDIVTDVLLIAFPIPLVIMSSMRMKRKISLIFLFLLSTILIAITSYRIPSTIARNEPQQYRSLLASLEIVAATGVCNAIVIGSFVRDRGVKRAKFRAPSVEEDGLVRQRSRAKTITQNHWGSDEDLVRDFGVAVDPSLRHSSIACETTAIPAPIAQPAVRTTQLERRETIDSNWSFAAGMQRRRDSEASVSTSSTDIKLHDLGGLSVILEPPSPGTQRNEPKMGFFEVGSMMDDPIPQHMEQTQALAQASSHSPPGANLFISDVGGLLGSQRASSSLQNDDIKETSSDATGLSVTQRPRHREDLKEFLRSASSFRNTTSREPGSARQSGGTSPAPTKALAIPADTAADDLDIFDAGGLLK